MKKVLLISIALFAFIITSNAQVSFGPKVGLNLSNISTNDKTIDDKEMKIGAQVGVAADFAFGDAISLQTGLLFSQKGLKIPSGDSDVDETTVFNVNYLDIPIHAVYGLDLGGNKLQFFAGPYVGVGLSGKIKFKGDDVPDEMDDWTIGFTNDVTEDFEDDYPMKRLDYGLDFGAGFMISNIQIQAQYSLGLANLVPTWDGETLVNADDEDLKNKNGVISFSVAYFFGK